MVFANTPPFLDWAPLPPQWVADGWMRLRLSKGTLVPELVPVQMLLAKHANQTVFDPAAPPGMLSAPDGAGYARPLPTQSGLPQGMVPAHMMLQPGMQAMHYSWWTMPSALLLTPPPLPPWTI